MKNIEDIINEMNQSSTGHTDRKSLVVLIKTIIQDAKDFFTSLSDKLINKITSNQYKVEVSNQIKLPNIQKIEGKVDIDTRALVIGLNEVIKSVKEVQKQIKSQKFPEPEKIKFDAVIKAINSIKIPENKIPDYPKEISVSNLTELKKYFDALKLSVNIPETKIPSFPKEIAVNNFPKQIEEKSEEMTGLYWDTNDNGDLTEMVEQYPSGNITSSGWSLKRVKINDKRSKK